MSKLVQERDKHKPPHPFFMLVLASTAITLMILVIL